MDVHDVIAPGTTSSRAIAARPLRSCHSVFFHVIVSNHFFVLLFHLKKKTFHIIDNIAEKVDYDVKYKRICELVQSLFVKHLTAFGHPASLKLRKIERASVMGFKWKTHQKGQDRGVFAMMQMKQYTDQPLNKWDCGLDIEGRMQRMQLRCLQIKFDAKIILHEFNIHKEKVHALIDEFSHAHYRDSSGRSGFIPIVESAN